MNRSKSRAPVPRWQKQDIFSKKWFQLRIILCYILILMGGAAGLSYAIYHYSYRRIRHEMFRSHSDVSTPWELVKDYIFMANGIATAATILIAIIATVLILRTVSRGARRLADNLRSSLGGTLPRDWQAPLGIYEFQHLHRLLAEALETHNERVRELQMLSSLLAERVQSVQERIKEGGVKNTPQLLRDLHVQCEKLNSAYDGFTLKDI